jgi:hypothetical protein
MKEMMERIDTPRTGTFVWLGLVAFSLTVRMGFSFGVAYQEKKRVGETETVAISPVLQTTMWNLSTLN